MWVLVAMVALSTLASALAGAAPVGDRLGQVLLAYPADDGLRRGAAAERRWLTGEGCVVTSATTADRAALRRVIRRLATTLEDPAFRALIAQKADWAVPVGHAADPGDTWVIDTRAGARALARLDGEDGPAVLDVLTYSGRPCLAGEATNAYSVPSRAVLLLRRPYLEAQLGRGEYGERQLAATLLHEVLHDLGFVHPHPDEGLDAPAYVSSVPVFVSCAARYWPDRDAIDAGCPGAPGAAVARR